MTDRLIRIKASRAGYRRGGLALGPDWQVVDTSSLTRDQQLALLGDPAVVIEGHDGDDAWSPMPAVIRDGLAALLEGSEPEGDVVEGDGSGKALAELDPELLASAELGRDLESAIADNQSLLEGFDLWPVEEPARLFLVVVDRLADAGGEIERLTAELTAAKAITPASEGQDGGGGAPAAPAAAPPAEEPKPAATAGGGAATKPAPKPKPAAGKKPASKAGA